MARFRINVDTPVLPDPKVYAWLQANHIDPADVLAAQHIVVENNALFYIAIVRDEQGRARMGRDGVLTEARTTPMLADPRAYRLVS